MALVELVKPLVDAIRVAYKNTRWDGTVKRTQSDVNMQVVSLKDYGAKLDGVTDDTAAIQRAIDSFPVGQWIPDTQIPRDNREYSTFTLDGSGHIAMVTNTIVIKPGVNIQNLTLRAGASVNWAANAVVANANDGAKFWGRITNLTIDGNHQDCRGVMVYNGYDSFWSTIKIVNTIRDAFTVNSGGVFLNNFLFVLSHADKLAGGTKGDTSTGLKVLGPDGYYSNGVIEFFPVGVYAAGANNHFHQIHPWSGFYNNGVDIGSAGGYEMRVAFLINSSNQSFSQCYADSPSKKDYTKSNNTTIGGIPNGGIGFHFGKGVWNCSLIDCSLVSLTSSFNNCTDGRSGLTNQLTPWLIVDGKNNRIVNFRCAGGVEVAPAMYSSAAVENATTVIGAERETNKLFSRVAGQDVLRVSTEFGSVTKLIDFWGNGRNVGYVQQRDTDTLRHYANRSLQLAVGAVAPLEVYAGADGTDAPTLRPTQSSVANLGDATFRYVTVYLTTNPNVSSDARLKSEVQNIPDALVDLAMRTPIKRYKLNSLGEYHFGIIITEEFVQSLSAVESEALNGLISVGEDGMYGIAYTDWQNILLEGLRRKVQAQV